MHTLTNRDTSPQGGASRVCHAHCSTRASSNSSGQPDDSKGASPFSADDAAVHSDCVARLSRCYAAQVLIVHSLALAFGPRVFCGSDQVRSSRKSAQSCRLQYNIVPAKYVAISITATVRPIMWTQTSMKGLQHGQMSEIEKAESAESRLPQVRSSLTGLDQEVSEPDDRVSEDTVTHPGGWRLTAILTSLCLGTLLVAIDNTIIGVAVPEISTVFDALDDVGWYGSAYLLTVTAVQPTFGNIYKYFDIKYTYIASVIIFESKEGLWCG